MSVARWRALTHTGLTQIELDEIPVEMSVARLRALTHTGLTQIELDEIPVEMSVARLRALTQHLHADHRSVISW